VHEQVVLRGMHSYPPQTTLANFMTWGDRVGSGARDFKDRDSDTTNASRNISLVGEASMGFWDIPPRKPPNRGFEHTIKLEEGVHAVITTPYKKPKAYWEDIKRVI